MKTITVNERAALIAKRLGYSDYVIRRILISDHAIRRKLGMPHEIMPTSRNLAKFNKQREQYRESDGA